LAVSQSRRPNCAPHEGRGERVRGNRVRASTSRRNGSLKNTARYAVKSFNREFPPLPNGDPDLSSTSAEELHTYLGLLTTAYEAIEAYIHWLRIINGAESAVVDGKINLDEIYASERNAGGGDSLKNFM
jgi:hypothetical protein